MSYLDTRDLIERQKILRDLPESEITAEEREELGELDQLEREIADWPHGATLIPEDEFVNYARDFADDIGAVDADANWPTSHIDWEAAADDLKMDFAAVEYQGTTYYVRS